MFLPKAKPGLVGFRSGQSGFSLFELLVALTILVLVLVPIAYFYGRMLASVEQTSIRRRAVELAMERIKELESYGPNLRANNNPKDESGYVKGDVISPPVNVVAFWGVTGPLDLANNNYLYDNTGPFYRSYQYFYPLPVAYNPYDPRTWGWDNTPAIDHFDPASSEYEYEPIGFMQGLSRSTDIATNDPRYNPSVESNTSGNRGFISRLSGSMLIQKHGADSREELYYMYGRRTVIMEVKNSVKDDDGDGLPPSSPFDGGATVYNPYPSILGPANKFEILAGRRDSMNPFVFNRMLDCDGLFAEGVFGWVTVIWLSADASERYIEFKDLNYVQIPFYFVKEGGFVKYLRPGQARPMNIGGFGAGQKYNIS